MQKRVKHQKPSIIDIHMHTYQFNRYGDPPPPNAVSGVVPVARTDNEAIDAYLAEMERFNIVEAYGFAQLEMVDKWISAAPDRITGGLQFPSNSTPESAMGVIEWPDLELLRTEYTSGHLGILGEITAQYAGVAPNDPKLEPYFALAEELDIPVCFHTGFGFPGLPYKGAPEFRMIHGNPLPLEEALVGHPNLRLYIAHGGYPYLQETIAIMYMYPHVYADISAINWFIPREEFHGYLQRLIQSGFGKRLMFGSDQMIWPDAVGIAIEAMESADFLTEEQKRDIFYNNAVRFLQKRGPEMTLASNTEEGSSRAPV
jgi:predicted TIM-barrel fold metal-dependent hydrolase